MKLLGKEGLTFLISVLVIINTLSAQYGPEDFESQAIISSSLKAPGRMTIDVDDQIYVTDAIHRKILKYNSQGTLLDVINPNISPLSVAINKRGEVFAGDRDTGNIYKIAPDGTKVLFYKGIRLPNDMVFGSNNILYVTDSAAKKVFGLNVSGNVVTEFTHSTFVFPTGIAFDPQNNHILVSEHGGIGEDMECGGGCSICWSSTGPQTSIYIFDLEGNHINTFGCFGEEEGLFHRIQGISVGNCGFIYAVDPYLGRVSVFDAAGNYITMFGQQGDAQGEFNLPMDIIFNSDNNIYVSSMNKGEVDVFSMHQFLPTSTIVGTDELICQGTSTEVLVKLTGEAPWTFTYTIDGVNPVEITTSEGEYTIQANIEGLYEISALSDTSGNFASCFTGSKYIKVNNILPSATFLQESISRCEDFENNMRIEFTGEAPWTFTYTVDGLNPKEITTNQNIYVLSSEHNGLYEITALVDAAGCVSNTIVGNTVVEIYESPTSLIINGNNRIYIEEGASTDLAVEFTGTPPWTFIYMRDELDPISITTNESPYILSVFQEGTYEIKETSDLNCSSLSTDGFPEIVFLEPGYPTATMNNNVVCVDDTSEITIDFTGSGPWTFTYTLDGVSPTEITTSNTPYVFTPSGSGLIELVSVYDNLNKVGLVDGSVTIAPQANASYSYETNNLTVAFTNNSTNAHTHYWDFGDGNTSTEEHPTHIYSNEGDYVVTYTAYSKDCGFSEQIETIEVIDEALALDNYFHKNKKIDIYPNPSTGDFTIRLNPKDSIVNTINVVITSTSGQTIFNKTYNPDTLLNHQGKLYITININSFTRGIYIVYVSAGTFVEQEKLILKD